MIKRYETEELRKIFSEEHKMEVWVLVEKAVAQVQEELGIIPRGLSKKLEKVKVDPEKVEEVEKITNHDVIAFLEVVREQIGKKEGRWLHFGMTSYDLVDTAWGIVLRDGLNVILKEIDILLKILKQLSLKYRKTPQMGRTHGLFAQPITFGYKIKSWYQEVLRAKIRLKQALEEIAYGKLSGAVGSYTILPPDIEKKVMKILNLKPEPVSTQVIPRDRHAYLMTALVIYGCALERIATEIRNLSRSEIGEVSEPFTHGQKGSSAMPHKQNPITCERICGLVKVLRGYLVPAFENINLWHERDLTNSSVERVIIPDAFHIVHYTTKKMVWVLKNLRVFPERMMENINNSLGLYASQNLMNRLIEKGMNRKEAYDLVQELSFRAIESKIHLKEMAKDDDRIKKFLDVDEIEKIFDLKWFLRNIL
ncbi:MAG: adenylosuccinate lyase [candidate division WOR-3 bacterium]|nr:adenylosuccinate lyase [candidate division WOR-3 bacterium]